MSPILETLHANQLLIIKKVNYIMTALDDLNNAVSSLQSGFAQLDTSIQAEISALKDALSRDDSAAVEASAEAISTVSAQMNADAQALTASHP